MRLTTEESAILKTLRENGADFTALTELLKAIINARE